MSLDRATPLPPWQELDRASAPGGAELILYRRHNEYMIRADGLELMSSRAHGSEEAMASFACRRLRTTRNAHVLVGGLGMGYTLRAVLEILPPDAEVTMAELVPAVAAWNRGPLGTLAGKPLDDPRVTLSVEDVGVLLKKEKDRFDAILLDVDNGPTAMTSPANHHLYEKSGLIAARRALKPGGVLAVWSASPDKTFARRMEAAGFAAEVHEVLARGVPGEPTHTIFVGQSQANKEN